MNPFNAFGKIEPCDICHENVAVMHVIRPGKSMKLCISCAFKEGFVNKDKELQKAFETMGITPENADMYNTKMKDAQEMFPDGDISAAMEETFGNSSPEEVFNQIQEYFSHGGEKTDRKKDGKKEEADPVGNTAALAKKLEKDAAAILDKIPDKPAITSPAEKFKDDKDDNFAAAAEEADDAAGDSNSMFADLPFMAEEKQSGSAETSGKLKFLPKYALNLNEEVKAGKIDHLIGRKTELARLIQILNRRNKNNPVLLGEPGVGKTALAEGLAEAIVKGEVPGKLADFTVYLLDMTSLVAGTQFRGQFENRLKGVVDEVKSLGKIILVIDELHNIMGAGNSEGAMNAANILKPALARGELRIIGSTTLAEYRKSIEKDTALERRFQPIIVKEPNKADTLAMLYDKRDYLQDYHYVTYSDQVIQATYDLAERYITNRFFPDKAIDILDEAGSQANLHNKYLNIYQRAWKKAKSLKAQIKATEDLIANAGEVQNSNKSRLNTAEDETAEQAQADLAKSLNKMYAALAGLKANLAQEEEIIRDSESHLTRTAIKFSDIAAVIEQWTGIPVKEISESDSERLLHLASRLEEKVIGQHEAIVALAQAIKRQRLGLSSAEKPISFIFVGPTGVGKTELVKTLAACMFGRKDAYIRLDMSEYMESHTVSKMIGSPPGYVGYEDAGQLTEKVRRNPYSVILLDEIEKAHKDVFNILLQILDEGRLTDSQGRTVNFRNTIIVMTSNAGTGFKQAKIGFGADSYDSLEQQVQTALQEHFRPEFLNRVDEIIIFRHLQIKEIRQIIALMLRELNQALQSKKLQIVLSDKAQNLLAALGYDERYGARPLRKTLTAYVENRLADYYLQEKLVNVHDLTVEVPQEAEAACADYSTLCTTDKKCLQAWAGKLRFLNGTVELPPATEY
ncbi:ATP-dependent Clp protease ATP-binding subunit [Amygdalobacter indicium]|uniref:ATP-dependent Clp protease ATP-binding subunit n=1 Tax=Amygdalobacter indicium TaxID=3029272 RepID=UPI0027A3A90F|nr:ATP-dependent Clp protease ATP-binding subunit [Amygdalobacter indicium]WEG33955.1 ATP-dependent Clp protease ATP-binding subunit [Amygdalobacter indicium]